MKSKKSNIISIAVLLLLIVITFAWVFREYDFQETVKVLKRVDILLIVLAVFLNMIFILCEAWNLYQILKSLDANTTFLRCVKYVFIECYFCAITPSASGGQPAQMLYMKEDGIPLAKSSVSLLVVAIAYKGSLLVYAGVMYLVSKENFIDILGNYRYLFYLGLFMNIVAVVSMVLALCADKLIRKTAFVVLTILHHFHIVKHTEKLENRINHTMDNYREGSAYIRNHLEMFIEVLIVTLIQRTCRFAITYMIFLAFGLSGYQLFTVLMLQCIVSISADMLPIPGAVGVSETVYMKVFRNVFKEGFLLPSMVLSRGISFYGIVLLSSIVVIAVQIKKIGKK